MTLRDMCRPPFDKDYELCKSLHVEVITSTPGCVKIVARRGNPAHDDRAATNKKDYLPGEPRIQLHDREAMGSYLEEEFATPELNQLSPHLWLVAKQDSAHISSLTHQKVRGREIIVTEQPRLHLVWHNDRVFIKPLPKYLLSHAFWDFFLSPQSPIQPSLQNELRKAALGFLRSYSYLVRRRSDFDLAMDESHRLLPKKTTYSGFIKLIKSLETIDDCMVAPRYHYGELRLSRLNFWIKIFNFRFAYHKIEGQYSLYFARFYGPILFLFGVFSVILSAMQVIFAVLPLINDSDASWLDFAKASRTFSVMTLFVVAIVIMFFITTFMSLVFRETIYALNDLYHNGRSPRSKTEA